MDLIEYFENPMAKQDPPEFRIGDTVRVDVRITEGEKERIQSYVGTVIARKGSGIRETFTVRRISYGVGVERVFPVHSPNVVSVTVVRVGKVRRAKLYYLRGRQGKSAKVKEQIGGISKAEKNVEKVEEIAAPVVEAVEETAAEAVEETAAEAEAPAEEAAAESENV